MSRCWDLGMRLESNKTTTPNKDNESPNSDYNPRYVQLYPNSQALAHAGKKKHIKSGTQFVYII